MNKPDQPLETEKIESDNFFETMPMMADHFAYRDDSDSYLELSPDAKMERQIRSTAIITLLLVAIAALALGVLVWRGLNTIQGAVSPTTDATSFEL